MSIRENEYSTCLMQRTVFEIMHSFPTKRPICCGCAAVWSIKKSCLSGFWAELQYVIVHAYIVLQSFYCSLELCLRYRYPIDVEHNLTEQRIEMNDSKIFSEHLMLMPYWAKAKHYLFLFIRIFTGWLGPVRCWLTHGLWYVMCEAIQWRCMRCGCSTNCEALTRWDKRTCDWR